MSATDWVWLVLLVVGVFAAGVLVGVGLERVAHESTDVVAQVRTTEPPSHVSETRRTRAPFDVSPLDRPWDGDRDGWS